VSWHGNGFVDIALHRSEQLRGKESEGVQF
jgi:hypothetical protein